MTKLLNQYIEKLKSGNLYTIAARPAMGKTTVARNIANISSEKGKKVLYIHTEDTCKKEKLKGPNDKYDFLYRRLISVEEVRNIAFIGKYDVVIIDSFQYMYQKRNEDTAYKLKRFAEELNVVVIVLSHISRKAEIRKDHRPQISDMTRKMCGTLWKSSDGVLFLWRDAYYERHCTNDDMDFIIAKDIGGNSCRLFNMDFRKLKEIWDS